MHNLKQPPEIIEVLKKYARNPEGNMIISGKNGTGKSYAAKWIYNNFWCPDSDYKKFISQSSMNIEWNKQLNEWKDSSYLLDQYLKMDLLVIDDIGVRTPTEAFMDYLYAIVDHRYDRNAATIITTNLNYQDMSLKFGEHFVSRVASNIRYRFDGEDRRLNKKDYIEIPPPEYKSEMPF